MFKLYFPVVGIKSVKAGVAFSSHSLFSERVKLLNGKVAFWRGWAVGNTEPKDIAGLEATPCLARDFYYRKNSDIPLDNQLRLLDYLGKDYSGYLLFLNEPNEDTQANATASRALQMYIHTKKVLPNVKMIAPAISHRDFYNDFQWLKSWIEAVINDTGNVPDVTHWDIHTYIQTGNPLEPINKLEELLKTYNIKSPTFFISEWGATTPERAIEMKTAFDSDERIIRHYWYDQYLAYWDGDIREIQLFVENSEPLQLSTIGKAFISV